MTFIPVNVPPPTPGQWRLENHWESHPGVAYDIVTGEEREEDFTRIATTSDGGPQAYADAQLICQAHPLAELLAEYVLLDGACECSVEKSDQVWTGPTSNYTTTPIPRCRYCRSREVLRQTGLFADDGDTPTKEV